MALLSPIYLRNTFPCHASIIFWWNRIWELRCADGHSEVCVV